MRFSGCLSARRIKPSSTLARLRRLDGFDDGGDSPGSSDIMKHAGTAFLVVMLFSTLGLWGFAQQRNGSYAARLRDLENRYGKLEDDHRMIASLSDRHQRRIAQLEKERTELADQVDELRKLAAERETLRAQVADVSQQRDNLKVQLGAASRERDNFRTTMQIRTRERDTVTEQLQSYTKDLQSLLGKMESTLASASRTPNLEVIPASRRPD
jgi:septal ring factor EnvC (AmiA/AmiB activator)